MTLILLILLAGCDYHHMPSDVRKSLNLAGGNKKELLEVDSIRFHSRTTFTAEPDIMFIDAGYLIENIDLAYQAYSKIPEHLKYNQEIFMRFVLPYRNLNEPIEAGLRRYFFTRYHWVFERMHQYGSMHQAACDLLDSLNISFQHLYSDVEILVF